MSVELAKRGVNFILYLQQQPIFTGHWENFWLLCTRAGDPSSVFLIWAPLLYPFFGQTLIQFVLAGVFSEFFNGVFKWILLSDRPYWWIYESGAYTILPPLKQLPLTCETGPGSPSGHSMVSASVWLIFVLSFNSGKKTNKLINVVRWLAFFSFLILVALSRLYVATHFPHQVLLGMIVGLLIGVIVYRTSWKRFSFRFCIKTAGILLFLAALTFMGLRVLGINPDWSIVLALKWCQRREWVRMSTTPLASLFRDIGALLGFGLATELRDLSNDYNRYVSFWRKILASFMGWLMAQFTFVCFPTLQSLSLFYAVTCFQYFVISIMLFYVIPRMLNKEDEEKLDVKHRLKYTK